jgi:hypothetical protein
MEFFLGFLAGLFTAAVLLLSGIIPVVALALLEARE